MSSINTISIDKLARLIGLPGGPVIVDVRTEDDFAADPRLIPGSVRRPWANAEGWAGDFSGRPVIIVCSEGHKLSKGWPPGCATPGAPLIH